MHLKSTEMFHFQQKMTGDQRAALDDSGGELHVAQKVEEAERREVAQSKKHGAQVRRTDEAHK